MLKATTPFEYGVILNGSQTATALLTEIISFEYGVILNGSQTTAYQWTGGSWFEYGVILNGSFVSAYGLCVGNSFEYGVLSLAAICPRLFNERGGRSLLICRNFL